jgi:hypothetical protein
MHIFKGSGMVRENIVCSSKVLKVNLNPANQSRSKHILKFDSVYCPHTENTNS